MTRTTPTLAPKSPRKSRLTWQRLALVTPAMLLLVLACLAGWAWWRVRASLPQLDGTVTLEGLHEPVEIDRDALGVPTVRASSRSDAALALGYLHGQDRFFQMDLMRRRASGQLAELFGGVALPLDRVTRQHRLRSVARRALAAAPPERRRLLATYAQGVNAGLAELAEVPVEYLLLRVEPAPWIAEDSLLVVLAMFLDLNDPDGSHERVLGTLSDTLDPALFAFLAPAGCEWDAPVIGSARATPAPPGVETIDLRSTRPAPGRAPETAVEIVSPGSNSWAVSGSRTADGRALLANDMHLGLSVPNTWYRASLRFQVDDKITAVTGLTLPGTPAVVVGSTDRVAWGFTNSYGDWTDVVIVEPDPADPERYLVPGGSEALRHAEEAILVKDAPPETLDLRLTRWGPVIGKDHLGRPLAIRWIAHDPAAINLDLVDLEHAATLDEALDIAARCGIPPQNFVCADAGGHIGWTIAGMIPRRQGWDGRLPATWSEGSRRWDGWIDPADHPRIIDPPDGLIWTANARVVDGDMLAVLGDGGYELGARARQILDDLRAVDAPDEAAMLANQLDDRALFLGRWQQLLDDVLDRSPSRGEAQHAELRRLVHNWGGRAATASVGYRAVRAFRLEVIGRAIGPLLAPCRAVDETCTTGELRQVEGPVWRLLSDHPENLLDPAYATWEALLEAAADTVLSQLLDDGALAGRTWGERNTSRIRHPLSRALPALSGWLDMPSLALPGDGHMPRVQSPAFGASERMVVSPGHEDAGFLHMPCGQSGHPASPYYRAGHADWVEGRPTPFLPGPALHTLVLQPAAAAP